MAKKISSKKSLFGNSRSHSLKASRHAQKPNFQKTTLENGDKVILTAREIRTLKKQANVSEEQAA